MFKINNLLYKRINIFKIHIDYLDVRRPSRYPIKCYLYHWSIIKINNEDKSLIVVLNKNNNLKNILFLFYHNVFFYLYFVYFIFIIFLLFCLFYIFDNFHFKDKF